MKSSPFFGDYLETRFPPRKRKTRGVDLDQPVALEAKTALSRPLEGTYRSFVVFAWILFGGFVLLRLVILQLWYGNEYRAYADGNRITTTVTAAPRGVMSDRFGTPLVRNTPATSIWYTAPTTALPSDEYDAFIQRLTSLIPVSGEVQDSLLHAKPGARILITERVTHEQAIRLAAQQDLLPGIALVNDGIRTVLGTPTTWPHVLGYVGRMSETELTERLDDADSPYQAHDFIGKTALELQYEQILRGIPQIVKTEVDARGRELSVISKRDATPGENLVLSVDADLQEFVATRLSSAVRTARGFGGTVIVLDPHTGAVLTLVNAPGFDVNAFAGGDRDIVRAVLNDPHHPLFNRALAGQYPTGSTIKPIIAAAALKEGIITSGTRILSTGGLRIGDWYFPDWRTGGHGLVDLRQALADSVNTYFYIIGGGYENQEGLGVTRITDYARAYGLGVPTGIDLPGEAAGFLPSPGWKEEVKGERWYVGDTYHLAIGQGDILATPLQVAVFTSVFANGGTVVRPHLLLHPEGDIAVRNLIAEGVTTETILHDIRAGLRQTVLTGSARSLYSLPISSAGKTGTAQVGGDQEPHAWFTGYAPAERPEIVVTVLIENGGEGSTTAVPVARDIFEWWWMNREKYKE